MKAAVIGLGLIGASFAAALREAGYVVTGYDHSQQAASTALTQQTIDSVAPTAQAAVQDAELVVLAIYVRGIIELLPQIEPTLEAGCLVMDVASTKQDVVTAMNGLPDRVQVIGGHPMTGRMTAGADRPSAQLFKDTAFILTPCQRTTDETLTRVTKVIAEIGARSVIMDAETHDRLIALVSHVPRLLPVALMAAARQQQPDIWELAAGGFREATRAGAAPLGFWEDVFATNRQGLPDALTQLAGVLTELADAIRQGDGATIRRLSDAAQTDWQRLYGED